MERIDDLLSRSRRRGKSDFYRQCTLVQGSRRTVTWVENRFAYVGAFVLIKEEVLEGIWRIEAIYKSQALTGEQLSLAEDAHRHHRRRTDV